jgi:enterochelin esterase-like enzyme/acetyl esterase/lipase
MKKNLLCIFIHIITGSFLYAQKVISLYTSTAKGSESWTWTEASFDKIPGENYAYNITSPSITAYLPHPLAANGTAVIVAPGGAFHFLTMQNEGADVAKWLNSKGVAAFVLKYRTSRIFTDNPLTETMAKMNDFKKLDETNAAVVPLAMKDGLEAVSYVRTHAKEFNVDPSRIGFMGFSAGATVTMSVVNNATDTDRPNFVAPIYVYAAAIIGSEVPKAKTPIFVAVASDDQLGLLPHSVSLFNKWNDAKQPAELHVYEKGGHGFGIKKTNISADAWPEHLEKWMKMHNLLPPPLPPTNMFQRAPTPNDTLSSVKVLSDGKVRFSIYAPLAEEVSLSGDFPGAFPNVKLTKTSNGVWTFTTSKALVPDVYTYDFNVDGIKTFDPKNKQYKESLNGFSNLYEIVGPENDFQSMKNVPHGKLEIINYKSSALEGLDRRLHVYTPPNYDKTKGKLPVLYLLHGGGDSDAAWSTVGKANMILDNLYAQNKLKPMIVVMPAGHTPLKGVAMGAGPDQDPFCLDMLQDIIPLIEKSYRVSPKREHRAVAGLSMGGIQTLNLALWNPEKFAYVYPMSTGYFENTIKEIEEKHSAILKNPALNKFNLFTIGMGKDDQLAYKNNQAMMTLLKKYNINFNYVETEGTHSFMVWRRNLAYIAPFLFK